MSAQVVGACASCGASAEHGGKFCPLCGMELASSAAGPTAWPPAKLVMVLPDGTDGSSLSLVGDQIDLGRSEGDLIFDDAHLSARHARLVRRGDQLVLVPLEARNGVYVRLRKPADLVDGDQVLIGRQVLRFETLSDAERTIRPAVEHGVVLFGTPVKAPWGRLRQMTAAGTSLDVYHLTRAEVTLGREQADVVFSDDEFLSRKHARLSFRAGRVTLEDLASSNGTYLRLKGPHPLVAGEMIRMGDELLRFELG